MNRPKLILVRPPESMGPVGRQMIHEPLNLLLLAAHAKRQKAEVRLVDFAIEKYSANLFAREIRAFEPDLVGFSCMTQDVHAAAELAFVAKQAYAKTLTLAGGIHPTVLPERTLTEFSQFDAVAVGEGEHTLGEILLKIGRGEKNPFKNVAGAGWRDETGRIKIEPEREFVDDLGELAHPARDLIDANSYFRRTSTPGIFGGARKVGTIITSRGCPYRCIFCSGWKTCGRKVRSVPLDWIDREVGALVKNWGVGHITIKDDSFTLDADRTIEVGNILADAGVTWDCKTRINALDERLLAEMKRLGCIRVHLGAESGSDRILKLIRKNTTVRMIEDAFAKTRNAGLERTAYFIVGAHPSETIEEFEQSLNLCSRLEPDYAVFSVLTPYPGTESWDLMKKQGWILSEDWRRFNPFVQVPTWRTEHFTPEDLIRLQKQAMRKIYFSPWFLKGKIKTLRHPAAWKYWMRSALDFVVYNARR